MTNEQSNLLADEMRALGFEAHESNQSVLIALSNRSVDQIEVKMALDQIFGHADFTLSHRLGGILVR